jgi:hypothetical protein
MFWFVLNFLALVHFHLFVGRRQNVGSNLLATANAKINNVEHGVLVLWQKDKQHIIVIECGGFSSATSTSCELPILFEKQIQGLPSHKKYIYL